MTSIQSHEGLRIFLFSSLTLLNHYMCGYAQIVIPVTESHDWLYSTMGMPVEQRMHIYICALSHPAGEVHRSNRMYYCSSSGCKCICVLKADCEASQWEFTGAVICECACLCLYCMMKWGLYICKPVVFDTVCPQAHICV